jgi:uncharacterized protein YjbI with pentapeptide repeats
MRARIPIEQLLLGLVLAAATAAFAAPPAFAVPPEQVLTGTHVRALVSKGPVGLRGVTIRGTLDLRPLGTVEHPFACRNCRLEGDLIGSGVVFARTLDLSGSQITGAVKMQGARFREPVLLGSPPAPGATQFGGKVDFSLAKFDDFVTFEEARFSKGADFVYTRFGGEAIFTYGTFAATASFDRAWFTSGTDFRYAVFRTRSSFVSSELRGSADFSNAQFLREVDLHLARFDGDGSFYGTGFLGSDSDWSATFEGVTVGGSVNFGFSSFRNDAEFSRMTGRRVSFEDAQFPPRPSVVMADFSAIDLRMSVGTVLQSMQHDERRAILRLIERSAKSRGDLGTANDAHYAQEVLTGDAYSWPRRSLDFAFYRLVAGYFVRPLRPLTAFVVLVLLFSIARYIRTEQEAEQNEQTPPQEEPASRRRRLRLRAVGHGLSRLGGQCLDTISFVGRLKARPDGAAVGVPSRLEMLTYRALVVCVLIGLANSNSTLRQMFYALL